MTMSAKPINEMQRTIREHGLIGADFDGDEEATILRALALLAAVEDGDEIVRELRECEAGNVEDGFYERARICDKAAARITLDAQERESIIKQFEELIAQGQAKMDALKGELASVKAERECEWTQDGDEDSDCWMAGCGNAFSITDGKPSENEFKHCVYCGGKLIEHPFVCETDEEGA